MIYLHEELNFGWIYYIARHGESSSSFRIDWYFDFILINMENTTLLKHIVQTGRGMFRDISEIVKNSVLFKMKLKSVTQLATFHYNTIQCKYIKRNTYRCIYKLGKWSHGAVYRKDNGDLLVVQILFLHQKAGFGNKLNK